MLVRVRVRVLVLAPAPAVPPPCAAASLVPSGAGAAGSAVRVTPRFPRSRSRAAVRVTPRFPPSQEQDSWLVGGVLGDLGQWGQARQCPPGQDPVLGPRW